MVRSFIVLLLFVVFFLSGTLYGMSKDSSEQIDSANEVEDTEMVPVENKEIELEESIVSQSIDEDVMDMDANVHLTQKTASFLETSVQGVYEVIVQILYQISEIFF